MQAPGVEETPRHRLNHPSPREKAYTKPGKGSKPPSVGRSEKRTPRKWRGGSSREFGKELARRQRWAEFQRINADLDYNDAMYIDQFNDGLNTDVQRQLALLDSRPDNMTDFANKAIALDNQLFNFRTLRTRYEPQFHHHPYTKGPNHESQPSDPKPMELDSTQRPRPRDKIEDEKCGKICLTASPHATTITKKRAEAEYERSVGRSWEKAYAVVSRPHEETKRENPELAQQMTMDNNNQKQDEEEERFRIQEAWEEYVEDQEEVEQSGRSQDHTNEQGEVKRAGSTEDEDDPERPTLWQTLEAPNVPKKTT
jgi:hypothetical protein